MTTKMKLCPICATTYPAGHRTCPTHGAVLVETPELPPGTMVRDCYRIERTLGKGGMGTVYLAEHTLMGEPRALKFLSSALASNPVFVQRFLQEARAASKLRHPNIAQTLELGQTEDGSFYISMEFVDGPSLRALLDQSPRGLPPERVFNIVRGVAAALGAAHAKRMVHRDIKPENILLAWTPESEIAKVVDFGIVAISDSVGRLTQTGRPLLTAEYAAPEQWRGNIPPAELDGRTDLYSLGCMFFEMLTGRQPFQSETYEGWFEQHVYTVPPPPSELRPDLTRQPGVNAALLDGLVLRLMAKEREQRPANVAELLADLDQITELNSANGRLVPEPQSSLRRSTALESLNLPETATVPGLGAVEGQAGQPGHAGNPGHFAQHGQAGAGSLAGLVSNQIGQSHSSATDTPPSMPRSRRLLMGGLGALVILAASVAGTVLFLHRDDSSTRESARDSRDDQPPIQTPAQRAQDTPQPAPGGSPSAAGRPTPRVAPTPQVPGSSKVTPQPGGSSGGASAAEKAVSLFDDGKYKEAQPLLVESCNIGTGSSCNYLGWMYEHKLGVDQDYTRANALYQKGCQAGSMASCNNLGALYQDHLGVAQDYPKAVALYTKSCDGGFATGCDNLGYMYEFKEGVPEDFPKAVSLYDKACTLGSMAGCKDLGWLYQNKIGVEQDYGKAATLYNRACDGGNLQGCNNLGYLYQHKLGVEQDYQKANALFTKACNGNEAAACNSLGVMYEEKQGVAQDYPKAIALYTKACDLGNAVGCSDLGDLYRTGSGVPKDLNKARVLLGKGCNMGNKWGCDRLKEVPDGKS